MRFALIGHTGHWRTYVSVLRAYPETTLAAVAPASEVDRPGGFDHAPGLTESTRWYATAEELLARERLDWVQICARSDRTAPLALACLERGIPVVAEKPLAMDEAALARLWRASERVPIVPMHTLRSAPFVAAARRVVAKGQIGRPLISYHQKSYRWGSDRPDWFRDRRWFPGVAPYIGIHAIDWIVWILGGDWVTVSGWEHAARRDYPACASHAGYLLVGEGGAIAHLSVDYLRPAGAPSHGDERIRIAGSEGVVEATAHAGIDSLVRGERPPEPLPAVEPEDWYVAFVRSLRGEGSGLIARWEAFRATEIALRAQRAAETGRPQHLRESEYRPPRR